MPRILVHLATGPENPTRAALALLVARTAAEEGHEVRVFLAGDAVQLVRPETAEVAAGIGSCSPGWPMNASIRPASTAAPNPT